MIKRLFDTNIVSKTGRINPNKDKILKKYPHLMDEIVKATSHLEGDNISIKERIVVIRDEIQIQPKCKQCNTPIRLPADKKQYPTYCSVKCSKNDVDIQHQTKETIAKRYGIDRMKIRKSIEQTCKSRYGSISPLGNKDVWERGANTRKKRYGHNVASKCEEVKLRAQKTSLERYGTKYPSESPTISKKISQNHAKRLHGDINNRELLEDMHSTKTLTEIAKMFEISLSVVSSRFKDYNIDVHRHFSTSQIQREIYEYISSLHDDAVLNKKIPGCRQDIDIFIPSMNVGFEINGVFWHSEINGKHRKYHINKTEMCKESNISLFHITDYEWNNCRPIVQSRIRNLCHATDNKIHGRLCVVNEISRELAKDFLELNHIQGYVEASIRFGMFYDNQLVSVMTFGKSRFNDYQFELLRFASQLNVVVNGGANKLFNHFIKVYNPQNVISYCDKKWGLGGGYIQMGFKISHTSAPNYQYFHRSNPNRLFSRHIFQKHKLSTKLKLFHPDKSEWNNMILNGYDRIWDCGHMVFVWNT